MTARSACRSAIVRLNGRVQARYTHRVVDEADNQGAFSIQRARLALAGHAFTKALKYKFQADFGKGFVSLKDFYLDYGLSKLLVASTASGERLAMSAANSSAAPGASRNSHTLSRNVARASSQFRCWLRSRPIR